MSVLWISHVHVTDEEPYMRYAKLASQAFVEFGGEIVVRGGTYRQIEGPERERNIVIRFASMEDAVACYESATYQEAVQHARGACEREMVFVEELPQS
ncbi:MAG: DUF1330 domain-containing protein [Mangrovicoccus sp.]